MPLIYETLRKGDKSRFQRLVARIPIGAQVCGLASILLIAGSIAGPSWASSSGSHVELLVNPSHKVASSNRANAGECSVATPCHPSGAGSSKVESKRPPRRNSGHRGDDRP